MFAICWTIEQAVIYAYIVRVPATITQVSNIYSFIWLAFYAVLKNILLTGRRPSLLWEETGQYLAEIQDHSQVAARSLWQEWKPAEHTVTALVTGHCTAILCSLNEAPSIKE